LSTFRNNTRIVHLDISGNKITSIKHDTFNGNWYLLWLSLANNSITEIHPLTFRNNSGLCYLDISRNKINSLKPHSFSGIWYLTQLHTVLLSDNNLQRLASHIFTVCWSLQHLSLSGNNVSDLSVSSFYGLEQLDHHDLSNNNIKEFSPFAFQQFILDRYGGGRVSKLKYLNLARNKILYFNLEEYLTFDSRGNSSVTTFHLLSLNLSGNRLESLDAASLKWLNQSATGVDLAGNPWRCECAALREA
jgi:Leucine-rich repeat (LRR) protein